jgi:hypothetical protein
VRRRPDCARRTPVQVQDIGNTLKAGLGVKWPGNAVEKSEPVDQRRKFALKAVGTLNFRALCREYGISAKTGYKWRERFLRQGLEWMEDSRRPRSSPKQLSEGQVCEMVKLKL